MINIHLTAKLNSIRIKDLNSIKVKHVEHNSLYKINNMNISEKCQT